MINTVFRVLFLKTGTVYSFQNILLPLKTVYLSSSSLRTAMKASGVTSTEPS